MEETRSTFPPCISCNAHDELEDKFEDMRGRNYTEHAEIKTALAWGSKVLWTIVTLVGFTFLMVWNMRTDSAETKEDVAGIKKDIQYIGQKIDENIEHQKETKKDIDNKIDTCRDTMDDIRNGK